MVTVLMLLVVPIGLVLGIGWLIRRWPRLWWPASLLQALLLVLLQTYLFAPFFSDIASDLKMYWMSLLASVPLASFVLTVTLFNGTGMQSLSRARLHSTRSIGLEKAPLGAPTMARAGWMPRGVPWERYSVSSGIPARAQLVRSRSAAWLVLLGAASILVWGLMLGFLPSGPFGWLLLDVVALMPPFILLIRRRVRTAGELERRAAGAVVVQVVDPIKPELLEVALTRGIVVRQESDTWWVAMPRPGRRTGILLVAVNPKGLPTLAEDLISDDAWQRVLWIGASPLSRNARSGRTDGRRSWV